MAEKRMFAKKMIDSDLFLDMPQSTQLLYFHLSMHADDDGFVDSYKKIMRVVGCKEDDLKILLAKKFLLEFDSGVIVIRHWRINNYLRKDRYTETIYKEEKALLGVQGKESPYEFLLECTTGIPLGILDKNREDKNREDNNIIDVDVVDVKDKPTKAIRNIIPPTVEMVSEYCKERKNNVNAETFVDFYSSKGWIVGKNKMKDWQASVRTWERSSNNSNPSSVGTNGMKPIQDRKF